VQVSVIICLFTKIVGCICQVTQGRRTVPYIQVLITNPHRTVDKNGVHLKITTFSCIKFLKIYFSVIFIEDIRSYYANKQ